MRRQRHIDTQPATTGNNNSNNKNNKQAVDDFV